MRRKPGTPESWVDQIVKDIKRKKRKHHSAKEKIRIVLKGLRAKRASLSSAGVKALPQACIFHV